MERADNLVVFEAEIGWNDVGSWTTLSHIFSKDENQNVRIGEFAGIDSKRCIISSKSGVVVAIGIEDLIIVHTPDATLVCHKSRAQDLKNLFDLLNDSELKKYL